MRTVNEVLDAVKARNGITSDYKLAMFLGIGDGNLRNYRHGRSLPDEKACERIAAALGEQPFVLLAEMQALGATFQDGQSLQADGMEGFVAKLGGSEDEPPFYNTFVEFRWPA